MRNEAEQSVWRSSWLLRVVARWPAVAACVAAIAAVMAFATAMFFFTGRVELTVRNESSNAVESVVLLTPEAGPPGPLLGFGRLEPGQSLTRSTRIYTDCGPAALHIKSPNREQTLLAGFLLCDDGPFSWDVRISEGTISINGATSYITGRVIEGPPVVETVRGRPRLKSVWDH
jgi:hypothetical protein